MDKLSIYFNLKINRKIKYKKMNLLTIYRQSLKTAKQIPNINMSKFIERKLKYEYRQKTVLSKQEIQEKALDTLHQIKRYEKISKLYWEPVYNNIIKS